MFVEEQRVQWEGVELVSFRGPWQLAVVGAEQGHRSRQLFGLSQSFLSGFWQSSPRLYLLTF